MNRRSFSTRTPSSLPVLALLSSLAIPALDAHAGTTGSGAPETPELSGTPDATGAPKTFIRHAVIDTPGKEARIRLEMDEPGTIVVSFGEDPAASGLEAEIFNPLGESLGKAAAFNFIPGTVEVAIRDRWGHFARPEPVPVTLNVRPGVEPLEPNREEHPAVIRLNTWYDNILLPSDTDHFIFDVPKPGVLMVESTGRKNPIDTATRPVDGKRWTGGSAYVAKTAGRYILRMAPAYGGLETEPFRFRVAWVPDFGEEPRQLALNTATPAVIAWSGMVQRFTLQVPEPGMLNLSLMGAVPESTTIQLKQGEQQVEGPQIRRNVEAGPCEIAVFVRYNKASPRVFYLLANLYKTTDSNEPNDRQETATASTLGEPVRVSLFPESDTDWFRYEIPEEGFLTLEIETGAEDRHRAMRSLTVWKENENGLEQVEVPASATPRGARVGPFPVSPGPLYLSSFVRYRDIARLDFTMTPEFLTKSEADKGGQVFVIGLALNDKAKSNMAALTAATGGMYVDAESTDVLKERIEEVKVRAEKEARRRMGTGGGWIWVLMILGAAGGAGYYYRERLREIAHTYGWLLRARPPGG